MRESEGLYRSFSFLKQALIGLGALMLGLLVFGYFIFMRHVDAPRSWTVAEREISGGMLHFGEKVEKKAKVYERRPTDYFRGADGILFATNERLLFVGIAPTDQMQSEDAPPVMITDEFPNDTLLTMQPQRLFLLTAHGVVIQHPGYRKGTFGANRGEDKSLDDLIQYVNSRHAEQRASAAAERDLRERVKAMLNEPLYYTVRRGDALTLIAAKFDATDTQIREWNHLTGDKVVIGQRLLVKPPGNPHAAVLKKPGT